MSKLNAAVLDGSSVFVMSRENCRLFENHSRQLNEELTLKEAGSWESASRLVLTD